jgi:SAM-dependent methyltransferase
VMTRMHAMKRSDGSQGQTKVRHTKRYLSGWFRHHLLRRYLALPPAPEAVLLDVGGGTGNISYPFRDAFAAIVVVDIAGKALAALEKDVFRPVQSTALALPLRSASADRILSVDFQEHLLPEQVPILLDELHRVLKPGGVMAVFTSCYGPSLRRLIFRLQGRPSKGRLDWSDWHQDGHLNRLTAAEHLHLARQAGFQVARHCFYGHFFDPLARRFHQVVLGVLQSLGGRRGAGDAESLAQVYRRGKPSVWVEIYFRSLILFAYLDKLLLGRIPGGAIFMMLKKPLR